MSRPTLDLDSESGVSAVEYALLAVFIAVVIISVVVVLGVDARDAYASVSF